MLNIIIINEIVTKNNYKLSFFSFFFFGPRKKKKIEKFICDELFSLNWKAS